MRKKDKYSNYHDLAKLETEGVDFEIEVSHESGSLVAIIAPHAGKIEVETGELAKAIAGDKANDSMDIIAVYNQLCI